MNTLGGNREIEELCRVNQHEDRRAEPMGLPIQAWKDWISSRRMSVGQFYNMIHGLVGAGFIEKRESKWHVSSSFIRELENMLSVYSSASQPQKIERPIIQ